MYDDVVVVKATAPKMHFLALKTTHVTAEKLTVLSKNDVPLVDIDTSVK